MSSHSSHHPLPAVAPLPVRPPGAQKLLDLIGRHPLPAPTVPVAPVILPLATVDQIRDHFQQHQGPGRFVVNLDAAAACRLRCAARSRGLSCSAFIRAAIADLAGKDGAA